jgi:hypothetical protein
MGLVRMNISELVRERPEARRVGVHFDDRIHVVQQAKRLYVELGIAVDIHDTSISIEVPRIAATWFQGLLERATGHIGYSEWD